MFRFSLTRGFTLIELVIGIVAFAIVITLVTGLILPQASRSIDPIFQVRATELAQGLLNEISAKAFDEASDFSTGGQIRCGENLAGGPLAGLVVVLPCTLPTNLGRDDGETRAGFDDVDDFDGLDLSNGGIVNSLGEGISLGALNLYDGFRVQVSVFYDANFDGVDDNAVGNVKFIGVAVTTPNTETLQFSSYRTNF